MRITPYGVREVVTACAAAAVFAGVVFFLARRHELPALLLLLVPAVAALFFVCWFFRDPERTVPGGPGLLVSPADGVVTHLDQVEEPSFIGGKAWRCSIFMSVFDVHVNRFPLAGEVAHVVFTPGEFFDARREESLVKNQNQDMGLVSSEPGLPSRVLVRQSTGAIARRIVCPVKPGDRLARGERYGMIKFGSRVTLFLSLDRDVAWKVKPGDKVKGGESVLASSAKPE